MGDSDPAILNKAPGENLRPDDADLIARTENGDRDAWRLLYVRHRQFVYATAYRFLGDDAVARDVTQEVFVSLFSKVGAYRSAGKFHGFLRRVTVNRCINERTGASNRHTSRVTDAVLDGFADHQPNAEARLEQNQTAAAVQAAIAALPGRQRMAVILSRFEGLSYEEIAHALDCSVSSVESLLFRARQNLADALAGMNVHSPKGKP